MEICCIRTACTPCTRGTWCTRCTRCAACALGAGIPTMSNMCILYIYISLLLNTTEEDWIDHYPPIWYILCVDVYTYVYIYIYIIIYSYIYIIKYNYIHIQSYMLCIYIIYIYIYDIIYIYYNPSCDHGTGPIPWWREQRPGGGSSRESDLHILQGDAKICELQLQHNLRAIRRGGRPAANLPRFGLQSASSEGEPNPKVSKGAVQRDWFLEVANLQPSSLQMVAFLLLRTLELVTPRPARLGKPGHWQEVFVAALVPRSCRIWVSQNSTKLRTGRVREPSL